ncbi:hypothetical protein HHK36_011414 [Tetracentron sinense]|uniref:Protein FAR1-RELATED SEQUENCE n=1 Tax=Tetracentron sinense TaxID=13715 RepID=A0A834ZIK3_TETSI|nr:hypothetical protein HHK36_011414 [Tetracentron sinense]
MRGILCSHAIKVLRDVMNIMELPNQYILKRWTRKPMIECEQDMHGRDIQVDARLQQTTWYRSLCSIFTRISFRASETEDTYNMADEKTKELLKVIEDMLNLKFHGMVQDNDNHNSPSITCEGNVEAHCLEDLNDMQAKGLKKKAPPAHRGRRRIKSQLEIGLAKKKKKSANTHSLEEATSTSLSLLIQEENIVELEGIEVCYRIREKNDALGLILALPV